MQIYKMMLRVVGFGLVLGLSGWALAADQDEGNQAELADLDEVAATFERSGFDLIASKENFMSLTAVSQTVEGLVQMGVSAADGRPVNSLRAWRLRDGALDPVPTPEAIEGRAIFEIATSSSGWIALQDCILDDAGRSTHFYESLNLIAPDGQTESIEIEEATSFTANGVNDEGVVVGWYSITGRSIAYCWSARFGTRRLKGMGLSSVANAISNEGVIVGQAIDPETSKYRAMVWSLDGEGEALPTVEGFESSDAVMADGRGRVLVSHFNTKIHQDGKVLHQYMIGQAYVWDKEEGYTRVKAPEELSALPLAMSDRGEVLMRCTEMRPPKELGTIVIGDFYLSTADRVLRLPEFPGASFTRYIGLSPEGYISGIANFAPIDGQPRAVGFVIRVKTNE